MAKGSIKSKIPIVKIDEFVLHRTRRKKYQGTIDNPESLYLAKDLYHKTKTISEILDNKLVQSHLVELIIQKDLTFLGKYGTSLVNLQSELILLAHQLVLGKSVDYKKLLVPYFEKYKKEIQKILQDDFENFLYTCCTGEVDTVARELLKKYINSSPTNYIYESRIRNKTIKNMKHDECEKYFEEYSSDKLSNAIRNFKMIGHDKTFKNRAKYIKAHFEEFLRRNNHFSNFIKEKEDYLKKIGISNDVKFKTSSSDDIKNIEKDKDVKNVKFSDICHLDYHFKYRGASPNFNTATGLSLLIGSVWNYEVKVKNFVIYYDSKYDYELEFTVYDHFSLDEDDVIPENQGKWYSPKALGIQAVTGFSSWYILQFYKGFKGYTPIITKARFSYTKAELGEEDGKTTKK